MLGALPYFPLSLIALHLIGRRNVCRNRNALLSNCNTGRVRMLEPLRFVLIIIAVPCVFELIGMVCPKSPTLRLDQDVLRSSIPFSLLLCYLILSDAGVSDLFTNPSCPTLLKGLLVDPFSKRSLAWALNSVGCVRVQLPECSCPTVKTLKLGLHNESGLAPMHSEFLIPSKT
jgi:hypothetical protein